MIAALFMIFFAILAIAGFFFSCSLTAADHFDQRFDKLEKKIEELKK